MHSAVQIVVAWQDIKTGDGIRLHPDVALVVAAVNPGQWLVIRGATVTRRLCATAGFDECPPKKQPGLIPLLPVTFGSRAATVDRPHDGPGGQ
jgi:hypothetical protein